MFPVRDRTGRVLFLARHHSEEDLVEITRPYDELVRRVFQGRSMHGNCVQMFEFVGRKLARRAVNTSAVTNWQNNVNP